MARPGNVIGWKLDQAERDALLERFPPRYVQAVADHVTLKVGAARDPLPPEVSAAIVGCVDDDAGVQAYVVAIEVRPTGPITRCSI